MTNDREKALAEEVAAELEAGNWPECPTCRLFPRDYRLKFFGIMGDAPTFYCETCGLIFAMDLRDAPASA